MIPRGKPLKSHSTPKYILAAATSFRCSICSEIHRCPSSDSLWLQPSRTFDMVVFRSQSLFSVCVFNSVHLFLIHTAFFFGNTWWRWFYCSHNTTFVTGLQLIACAQDCKKFNHRILYPNVYLFICTFLCNRWAWGNKIPFQHMVKLHVQISRPQRIIHNWKANNHLARTESFAQSTHATFHWCTFIY